MRAAYPLRGETCRALVEPLQTLSYLAIRFFLSFLLRSGTTRQPSQDTFINAILLTLSGMTDD